jgi:gluconate 2-dehydrogenase gamma chain
MFDRRSFLQILASSAAALGAGPAAAAVDPLAREAHHHHALQSALGTLQKAYTFFTAPEAKFVEAAVARLIPNDELGPGALEAEVPFFIDQQLSGSYGTGGRTYMQGPWGESSPHQGYQLPLLPQQVFRIGIAATDRYCQATFRGKSFAELTVTQQDDVLRGLQGMAGDVKLDDVPARTFFTLLLLKTIEGFFADPIYGGNQGMVGWKLVGFPGVAANYTDAIRKENTPYNVEPVSIRDMQQAQLDRDQHGHPVHRHARLEDIRARNRAIDASFAATGGTPDTPIGVIVDGELPGATDIV